jgi:hypothetical protein
VLPNGSRKMAPPAVSDRLDAVRDLVLVHIPAGRS